MLDSLYKKFAGYATFKVSMVLLILGVICKLGFDWRDKVFGEQISLLDGRFIKKGQIWYNPTEILDLFTSLGKENLQLYWISEVTLDVIFPIVYVSLLAFIIIQLFSPNQAKYLILLPILGGTFDLLENFTITFSAISFRDSLSPAACLIPFFSAIKWLFSLLLSLPVVLIGLMLFARKNYRMSRQ